MKLIDYILEKINNFENFLLEQAEQTDIDKTVSDQIFKDIEVYKEDIGSFIAVFKTISKMDNIDKQIKLFFSIYDVDIFEVEGFDMDKFKSYILMFCDLCQKF